MLGAVGTLVWDRIRHPTASGPVEQWGGAVYSLAALAASCPPGWRVAPLVKVGADLFPDAVALLDELPGAGRSRGLTAVPEANNRVELRYLDAVNRTETLTGGVPPWSWEELEPRVAGLDALYVNFLSGSELSLATAERLRRGFPGPIYADLHSLFLAPPGDGLRAPRRLPQWERWLACFDAVQLNEVEMGLLLDAPDADAAALLPFGPSLALVTRGERGASFAARSGLPSDPLRWRDAVPGGEGESGLVPPPDGPVEGDPTGCGDVWGSVAWTGLLGGLPLRLAMERAHRAAAAKIRRPSTSGLQLTLREAL